MLTQSIKKYRGGLEILFRNQRQHRIDLPLSSSSTLKSNVSSNGDSSSSPGALATTPTVQDLINHLTNTFLARASKKRREMFVLEEGDGDCSSSAMSKSDGEKDHGQASKKTLTVRPGILVLINDADWEIDSGPLTALNPDDEVVFVSTLHGG